MSKRETFLNDPEDVRWLLETRLKGCPVPAFLSFVLIGNEDAPEALHLYASHEPNYTDAYYLVTFNHDGGPEHCTVELIAARA